MKNIIEDTEVTNEGDDIPEDEKEKDIEKLMEERVFKLKQKILSTRMYIRVVTNTGYVDLHVNTNTVNRLSYLLLEKYGEPSRETSIDLFSDKDHDAFVLIARYITYGIKINWDTFASRVGTKNRDEMVMFLDDWGYDESICLDW